MADVTGAVRMTANGKEYRLWMGASVIAALQGIYGNDVLAQLDPPAGAPVGWAPNVGIVVDLFRFSLERYHPEEANRWTADDLIGQNVGAFNILMGNSMPDPEPAPGNGRAPAKRKR